MFGKDKRRVYIAYYDRERSVADPDRYHVAILIAPKSPNPSEDDSLVLHIKTVGLTGWAYECRKIKSVTVRLRGVQLLGKIDGSISVWDIERMLGRIVINKAWICTDWAAEAMLVSDFFA